jgi:hypothetical protein
MYKQYKRLCTVDVLRIRNKSAKVKRGEDVENS